MTISYNVSHLNCSAPLKCAHHTAKFPPLQYGRELVGGGCGAVVWLCMQFGYVWAPQSMHSPRTYKKTKSCYESLMQPGIHCLMCESKCVWKWKIPTSAITLTTGAVSWEIAATYLIAAMNYEGQRERAVLL